MEKMIDIINSNLETVIKGINKHKEDNELTLKELENSINEKSKIVDKYADDINNSKMVVTNLDNEIVELESDQKELSNKYGSKNLSEIVEAANKAINSKILEKRELISEQNRNIVDLTEKISKIKKELETINEDKETVTKALQNSIILSKFYGDEVNRIISYTTENVNELEKYHFYENTNDSSNITIDSNIDSSIFDEIDSITVDTVDSSNINLDSIASDDNNDDKSIEEKVENILNDANGLIEKTNDIKNKADSILEQFDAIEDKKEEIVPEKEEEFKNEPLLNQSIDNLFAENENTNDVTDFDKLFDDTFIIDSIEEKEEIDDELSKLINQYNFDDINDVNKEDFSDVEKDINKILEDDSYLEELKSNDGINLLEENKEEDKLISINNDIFKDEELIVDEANKDDDDSFDEAEIMSYLNNFINNEATESKNESMIIPSVNEVNEEKEDKVTISVLSSLGFDENMFTIDDLAQINRYCSYDDVKDFVEVLEKNDINKEIIYSCANTLIKVDVDTLNKIFKLLDKTKANKKDICEFVKYFYFIDLDLLEKSINKDRNRELSEILIEAVVNADTKDIKTVFNLSDEDVDILDKSCIGNDFKIINTFTEVVFKNYSILDNLKIDNLKECFTKYPHRFVFDNSTFNDILDKYDTEDLIRCINKNAAVINRL